MGGAQLADAVVGTRARRLTDGPIRLPRADRFTRLRPDCAAGKSFITGVTIRVVGGWVVKRVVLAFLTVGLLLGGTVLTLVRTQGSNVSIALFGSHTNGWGFSSGTETIPGPTINVNQNDFVTLSLTSTDGLSHEFLLDYNGNGAADPGEPVSPIFSTTTQVSFTASVAGSFTYLCLFHPATMHGTWNTASANTPPTVGALSAAPTPAIPGQQVTFSATSSDANRNGTACRFIRERIRLRDAGSADRHDRVRTDDGLARILRGLRIAAHHDESGRGRHDFD